MLFLGHCQTGPWNVLRDLTFTAGGRIRPCSSATVLISRSSVTQATPVISLLDIHDDRRRDIVRESPFVTTPAVPVSNYTDQFGNRCRRLIAPKATSRCASTA